MLRTFVEDRTCESEGDPERDCEALCFAPSLRTGVDRAAAAVTVIAKALCFAPSLRGAQRRPGPDTEPNCEVLCFALSLGRPAHEHDRASLLRSSMLRAFVKDQAVALHGESDADCGTVCLRFR